MLGLLFAVQLSTSISPLSAMPDGDVAAAVAIGLACAEHAGVEAPAAVEVARPKRPARADVERPEADSVGWLRACDQYGCRLVPCIPSPGAFGPSPPADQASAAASSYVPGSEEDAGSAEGCRRRAGRGLFGRWR